MYLTVKQGTSTAAFKVTESYSGPYVRINSEYVLPITTRTTRGRNLTFQTGTKTYRAMVYTPGNQSTTTYTTATHSDHLSSVTALTCVSTSGTSYLTRSSTSGESYLTTNSTTGWQASFYFYNSYRRNGVTTWNSGSHRLPSITAYSTNGRYLMTGTYYISTNNATSYNLTRDWTGTLTTQTATATQYAIPWRLSSIVSTRVTVTNWSSNSFDYDDWQDNYTFYGATVNTAGKVVTTGTSYLTRASTSGESYLTRESTYGYSGISSSTYGTDRWD